MIDWTHTAYYEEKGMKMINMEELEQALTCFRDISDVIKQELFLYRKNISSIILDISSASYEDARLKFDELYVIQHIVAMIYYKYNFPIGDVLEKFMYDFDRDDEYSRKYWFEKIKKGDIDM